MVASLSTAPQRRYNYRGIRRHFKSVIVSIIFFCIFLNLIIYLSAEGPPVVLEPAEPVQRRQIIIPRILRDGLLNQRLNTPPAWMSDWFQYQRLDPAMTGDLAKATEIDLVYTWVNGTEPELAAMKAHYRELSPMFQALKEIKTVDSSRRTRPPVDVDTNRFRDMNELKYSVRSIAEYGYPEIFRKIHILRTEVVDQETGLKRGQIPEWLDLETSKDVVEMVSHSRIYDNVNNLPSFNSLAIESQMHHTPGMADIFAYFNDDVFLGKSLGIADFWTPVYGFVLHMDALVRVQPWKPEPVKDTANVAEWPSLQYTNYILSKQFGARFRAYIAHIPHILSVSIMEEIQATWPEEFAQTSSHRFRGEGGGHDLQVSYMLAHYVMERFRETQLESYWRYRLDKNQDGKLDWNERQQLIRMIDHYNSLHPEDKKGSPPHPTNKTFVSALEDHEERLQSVGIRWSNETRYALTGMDEYPFMLAYGDTSKSSNHQMIKPYLIPQKNRMCKLDIDFCFGVDFRNSSIPEVDASLHRGSIFERMAFTEFHCGDCLLHIVRQESTTPGMSALMPEDKNSKAYNEVLTNLAKYNYVIGQSSFSFLQLKNGIQAQNNLEQLMKMKSLQSFFCINDDVQDNPLIIERVKTIFSGFLERRLPSASPWEKREQQQQDQDQV